MPLLGTVSCPNTDTLIYAYNRTKFDHSSLTIPEIFKDVQNLKVGHVTLSTPLSGTASYRQAVTCYDKPSHQI